MVTRDGVGESNDLVKLVDEYQLQVPEKYKQIYEFDTVEEAKQFKKDFEKQGKILEDRKFEKDIKDSLGEVIGKKPVLNSNGKIQAVYCPVGEMVVRSIEKAARMMGSPVNITGGYLTGYSWAGTH